MKTQFKKGKTTSECYFCKKEGHLKNNYYGYKTWKEKQDTSKANEITKNKKESCLMTTEHTGMSITDMCLKTKKVKKNLIWYWDSAATSHMSCRKEDFITLDTTRRGNVSLADEEATLEVKGIGKCVLKCFLGPQNIKEMVLENILFVLRLVSNLVSLKKLTKESYKIVLEKEDCNIFKDGVLKATVEPYGDLYGVRTVEKVFITKEDSNNDCSKNCIHVWHRRFGHKDFGAIKSIQTEILAEGINVKDCLRTIEVCECCVQGKMTIKPFPKESNTNTKEPLDLIHTDVCGSMQTITPSKKRYILTIIDNYSRFTKIYLLERKDQVYEYIKDFIEIVKTQFSKKPKIIRSDRGKEYVNNQLQDYLRREGIKSQFTATYSPQQNGVAERKKRSLIEMTRCILIDGNLERKILGLRNLYSQLLTKQIAN